MGEMDATTIMCGTETRKRIKAYRDEHGYQNYDEALRNLLQRAEGESDE